MKKRLVSMLLGTLIVVTLVGCGKKNPSTPVVSLPESSVSEEQSKETASASDVESTLESEGSFVSSAESSSESKEESSEVIESSESEVPEEREPHESSEESKGSEESTSSKPSESKEQSKPSESKVQSKPSESKEQSKPSESTTPSVPESKPSEPTTPSVPESKPSVPESSTPSEPESVTPSVPESSTPSEPAHTHSYVTTTISEATCQKAKVVADVCSCGDKINEREEGEKKAHVLGYTAYPPGWEPDCTHGGMEYCYCANCGEPYGYNIVGTAPHDEELHVQRGNCVDAAHLIYTCKNCGIKRTEDSHDPQYCDDHEWNHGEGKEWHADEECWYYYEADWCRYCGTIKNRVDLGPREE